MSPIVPVIMAIGAILFFVGIIVLARLGFKQIKTVNFRGKTYPLWRFVLTTILSGVALIMLSVFIQKLLPAEELPEIDAPKPALSSNLKYELEAALPNVEENKSLMAAINRFQSEYQEAIQRRDKNTSDLLILEMSFLIRTELNERGYPAHQTEQEVVRIMKILRGGNE